MLICHRVIRKECLPKTQMSELNPDANSREDEDNTVKSIDRISTRSRPRITKRNAVKTPIMEKDNLHNGLKRSYKDKKKETLETSNDTRCTMFGFMTKGDANEKNDSKLLLPHFTHWKGKDYNATRELVTDISIIRQGA